MSRLLCLIIALVQWVRYTVALLTDQRIFTPYQFGGKGDAIANDSLPLQKALDAAAEFGGGILWVPPNGTHLISAGISAIGHKYDGITIQIDGIIKVASPPIQWAPCQPINPGVCVGADVFSAFNVNGITVTSKTGGSFLGYEFDEHHKPNPPAGPRFLNCSNVLIENIAVKHVSGSMWIRNSQNVMCRNLTLFNLRNPEETGNIEIGGIGSHGAPWSGGWQYEVHLLRADNVTLRDSFVNGGDDNICIKNDTSNVLVENCTVGDGHGVTIGSTPDCNGCYGYTENVTFRNIILTGDAPLKIKTWPNTTGMIKNILFENITLIKGAQTLLSIDTWYGSRGCRPHPWCHEWVKPTTKCRQVRFAGAAVTMGGVCTQTNDNIALQNITLRRIRGPVVFPGSILCREPAPCTINIEDVQLQTKLEWVCGNANFNSGGTTNTPPLPTCAVGPHVQETISV